MNKIWRNQKVYNGENEVLLKHSSVAQLWWEAFQRVNQRSFRSSESEEHQLDPFNYGLSIPCKSNLDNYDNKQVLLALLGQGNKNNLDGKNELATIYHELFHVFQTNSTQKALEYFYLVDDLQSKRVKLLEYLGNANFYTLAETTKSDYGKTIFHSIENYEQLGKMENFTSVFDEIIDERYKEIDEDTEKFILQYGEGHREQIEKEAKDAKDAKENFRETIEEQINDTIQMIQEQAVELKNYSDLSRSNIEKLIEFFKLHKDTNLHLFHLIEGSAQVFGWCCAGYDIEEKFALRKKEQEETNAISQSDTYEKAYELFKDYKGKTPLLFIIISLFSLSANQPIDVFMWSLKKLKTWEDTIESLIQKEETTSTIFTSIVLRLFDSIETSARGDFYNANSTSVHDREDEDSIFLKSISRIRKIAPKSNKLEFLIDLVLDKELVLHLIESFELHTKEFKADLRKNEVMRDFEKFLRYDGNDISIKCCNQHGIDVVYDFSWETCTNVDSFNQILLNYFKVLSPNRLIEG